MSGKQDLWTFIIQKTTWCVSKQRYVDIPNTSVLLKNENVLRFIS